MTNRELPEITARKGEFERWKPHCGVKFELVLDPWVESKYTEWVRAEEAIRREAELLARIQELEAQMAQVAGLISQATEVIDTRRGKVDTQRAVSVTTI